MTPQQIKTQMKATALNAIRKLYHPKAPPLDCWYQEGETQQGRRDDEVRRIIEQLEKDLVEFKQSNTATNNERK